MSGLPGILSAIARVTNAGVALRLAQARGGTEMTFSARRESALSKLVGQESARKIVDELGASRFMIPMASARGQHGRRAAVRKMLAEGATLNQAALACDVHVRTARRIKNPKQKPAPAPLFDDD